MGGPFALTVNARKSIYGIDNYPMTVEIPAMLSIKGGKKREMTIAAGFTCSDGAILFSDTEETLQSIKLPGHKGRLSPPDGRRLTVAMVGAGRTDSVTLLMEHVASALANVENVLDATVALRKAVRDVWVDHFLPDQAMAQMNPQLIVTLADPDDFSILKTDRTAAVHVAAYDAIGSGWETASSVFGRFYTPKMPLARAIALATYVLSQTKRYATGCGGESDIIAVTRNKSMFIDPRMISDMERFQNQFDAAIGKLMLDGQDMTVDGDRYTALVYKAADTIATLRSNDFSTAANAAKAKDENGKQLPENTEGT